MNEKITVSTPAEDKAWADAYGMNYPGAANPAAVARRLADDLAALIPVLGTRDAARHPAIQGLMGQLGFLCGVSLGPETEILAQMEAHAVRLGIRDPRCKPWSLEVSDV